ncbi:MAG: class I SAM-dependent methyltransferase [Cellulosilyticaceae bacterium]
MDKYHENSRQSYNHKAKHYTKTLDWKATAGLKDQLIEVIQLKRGNCILDIGCGIGDLLKRLSDKQLVHGFGLDVSEKMIEKAKLRYPFMRFEVGVAEVLPYEEKYFDAITIVGAFHHIPDPEQALAEIKRVLKDNKKLYIADFSIPFGVRQITNSIFPLLRSGDVRMYSKEEMVTLLEDAGFNKIEWHQKGIQFVVVAQ